MPSISIVIPMQDEAGNVAPVIDEVVEAMKDAPAYEIIVVNDCSTDSTGAELAEVAARVPNLRIFNNSVPSGKTNAVHNGVLAARADVVCLLDGDGQNPAFELERLWRPLMADTTGRLGLVAGQRRKRRDSSSKRFASRFANGLRSWLLKDGTQDTGCGLKGFRRDAYVALPYFDNMHRYQSALFLRDGWEVRLIDVEDRERLHGKSKFNNFQRARVGVVDLFGVAWLLRRRRKAIATEVDARQETST